MHLDGRSRPHRFYPDEHIDVLRNLLITQCQPASLMSNMISALADGKRSSMQIWHIGTHRCELRPANVERIPSRPCRRLHLKVVLGPPVTPALHPRFPEEHPREGTLDVLVLKISDRDIREWRKLQVFSQLARPVVVTKARQAIFQQLKNLTWQRMISLGPTPIAQHI